MNLNILMNIINFGQEIIFDDDVDDEANRQVPKVKGFAEETVPRFNTNQFRQNFRLLPNTFDILLSNLVEVKSRETRYVAGLQEIALDKQLMITVWYLANLESFRSVASRFDVSKSTCWDVLRKTSHRLLEVNRIFQILKWPSRQESLQTMKPLLDIYHFPGIIGCIDGSHIRIQAPKNFPNSYYNRKKIHSVIVQGVCNERKLFIDIYAGQPGSMHDSTVFNRSDLHERITNGDISFWNNGHLIGDLAYPLKTYLMVGFKNYGNFTEEQINFNNKLSKCRVNIENAFALLKGRFRRLKFIETVRLDLISMFVVVAGVLHNTCILNNDLPDDLVDIGQEMNEERVNNPVEIEHNELDNENARQKRLNVLHNLPL